MDICDRKALKARADKVLEQAPYSPRRLVLIHSVISLLPALLLSGISLLLSGPLASTGGLSGIGTRDLLETVQALLELVPSILLPFWSMGFFYSTLLILRGKEARPKSLLEGFRRFGPVLRLQLLQLLFYYLAAMAGCFVGMLFITPFSSDLVELLMPAMELTSEAEIEQFISGLSMEALVEAMLPMLLILLGMCFILIIPIAYRLRLSQYLIFEDPQMGAMAAMSASMRLTKGKCWQLFRLDLSFWWYHLITLALSLLAYGDTFIPLPMSAEAAYMLFYALYAALTVAQHWFFRPQVETTYAAAYEVLQLPPEEPLVQIDN